MPNGFIGQKAVDGNPLLMHLSGLELAEMRRIGFRNHGLSWFKFLRHEIDSETTVDDLFASIRVRRELSGL